MGGGVKSRSAQGQDRLGTDMTDSTRRPLTAPEKAARTAKWANTMVKHAISHATGGKRPGAPAVKAWQVVAFPGKAGAESRGVVDLLAVRRDHRSEHGGIRPGDLLEIVLLQVKGGSAPRPSGEDLKRLRRVQRWHRARAIVLAEWSKGDGATFFRLTRNEWEKTSVEDLFGRKAHLHLDPVRSPPQRNPGSGRR